MATRRSSSRRLAVAAARAACLEGMGKSLRLGAGCIRVYPACTYHISRVYKSCLENILRALSVPTRPERVDAARGRRHVSSVDERFRSSSIARATIARTPRTRARDRTTARERSRLETSRSTARSNRIETDRSFASVDDARRVERGRRGREFVEEDECRPSMTSRTRSGRRKR